MNQKWIEYLGGLYQQENIQIKENISVKPALKITETRVEEAIVKLKDNLSSFNFTLARRVNDKLL